MPAKMESPLKSRVLLLGIDSRLESEMATALRGESCEVILAADCRQAVEIIRGSEVDILVLDSDVPSQDLLQLASKFSFAARPCRTLVLADSLEQLTLAAETLADGVLMKPLDRNQMQAVIRNLLADAGTRGLTESRRPDNTRFSGPQSPRPDWGINE